MDQVAPQGMEEGYAQPPFGPNNPRPRGYAPPGYVMGPLDNLMTIAEAEAMQGFTKQPPAGQPAPQFFGGQNNAAPGSSTALPQQQSPKLPQQQPPTLPPQIGQQKFGDSGIGSLGGSGGQSNVSLNLQGSATMNPQGANQNRGYPGFDFNPGASGAGASGQMRLAKGGLASLGRGEDKMLVHMTPGEVASLQKLAMSHGGSLTINPHTGLPEAGFLRNILPAIAAAAAIYFTAGAAAPAVAGTAGAAGAAGAGAAGGLAGMAGSLYSTLGAQGVGALAGGVTGALTNKQNPLMGAVMGGLGGYGVGGGMGAGIESGAISPFSYGAETAGTAGNLAAQQATQQAGLVGMAPVEMAGLQSSGATTAPYLSLGEPASVALPAPGVTPNRAFADFVGDGYRSTVPTAPLPAPSAVTSTMAQQQATDAASPGFAGNPSLKPPTFMQALGEQFPTGMSKGAAGLGALGMVGAFDQPGLDFLAPQEARSTARLSGPVRRPYDPERNLFTDYGVLRPAYAAEGGEMRSVPQLEDGGFVLTKRAVDGMGGQREAQAGLGAIPIRGPGTGTSDSIPTTIDGVRPAKVSNGEAYVPRKRVKQAGGAKRLYALMRQAEQDAKRRAA